MPYGGAKRDINFKRSIPEQQAPFTNYEVEYEMVKTANGGSADTAVHDLEIGPVGGGLDYEFQNIPTFKEMPDLMFEVRPFPQMYEATLTEAGGSDTITIDQWGTIVFTEKTGFEGVYKYDTILKFPTWESIQGFRLPSMKYDYVVEIGLDDGTVYGKTKVYANGDGLYIDCRRINYDPTAELWLTIIWHDVDAALYNIFPLDAGDACANSDLYITQGITEPLKVHVDIKNILDRVFSYPDVILASIGILEVAGAAKLQEKIMDPKFAGNHIQQAASILGMSAAVIASDLVAAIALASYYGWISAADYVTEPGKFITFLKEVVNVQQLLKFGAAIGVGAYGGKWAHAISGAVGGGMSYVFGTAVLQLLDDYAIEVEP
jgi:hypothetical protein